MMEVRGVSVLHHKPLSTTPEFLLLPDSWRVEVGCQRRQPGNQRVGTSHPWPPASRERSRSRDWVLTNDLVSDACVMEPP